MQQLTTILQSAVSMGTCLIQRTRLWAWNRDRTKRIIGREIENTHSHRLTHTDTQTHTNTAPTDRDRQRVGGSARGREVRIDYSGINCQWVVAFQYPFSHKFILCPISKLFRGKLSETIGLLEKFIQEDPKTNLKSNLVFNLCTLYDLQSDNSTEKKKQATSNALLHSKITLTANWVFYSINTRESWWVRKRGF